MPISGLFRLRGARGVALLTTMLLGYTAATGCNGRTTSNSSADASAGEAQDAAGSAQLPGSGGGQASGGHAEVGNGGAASSGASRGGSHAGGSGSTTGGTTSGGATGGKGGNTAGGSTTGGAAHGGNGAGGNATAGVSHGGVGGTLGGGSGPVIDSAGYGDGGYPPGYMCVNGVCGIQCELDGNIAWPGTMFWDACNQCQCGLDGVATCEKKNCDLDCDYLNNEYVAAYGEAQYCLQGETPDPCERRQLDRLDCNCQMPVTASVEFKDITAKWAKKWQDAGCTKAQGVVCPPCPTGSGDAVCDNQQAICVYQ